VETRKKAWYGLLLSALSIAALLPSQHAVGQTSYAEISPGDVLKISVYGNPDLTTVSRVLPDGTITFPLIGQVQVGGASPVEAEGRIAERLNRGGFVRNAAVSIFVSERSSVPVASVTLLGQVGRSGTYSLDPDSPDSVSNLIGLLAKAGGTTDRAADYAFLIRNEQGQPRRMRIDLADLMRNGDLKANVPLTKGDIVLVPEMDVFYIYGEVQRPGRYKLERSMTVMQGLSVASGITARGNAKGIVLNRQSDSGIRSVPSDLSDPLQPNDVVYVRTAVF
jgi:polysaccharide export outer membrane protein